MGRGYCGADGLYMPARFRRIAKRAKDAAQARRLLAIAAVLDGASREDAAEDWRDGPSDVAGLGYPVQRARTGWSHQHPFAGRAA